MPRIAWTDRVSIDPDIRHGEPCIRGTRVPVALMQYLVRLVSVVTPRGLRTRRPAPL